MNKKIESAFNFSVRDTILELGTPKVMGILNATPDSFSDGGKYISEQQAIDRIGQMLDEGASIIDIGGESTRPGSDRVSEREELDRVLPVLETALKNYPEGIYSIDTTKYKVAEESLKAGAKIINDVSGLEKEPGLAGLCAGYGAGYILMHSQGEPKTMQQNPVYESVIDQISDFFQKKLIELEKSGVESIIIDPGIGFGKTVNHNLQIVKELQKFTTFQRPVMLGASRKSMIGNILGNRPVDERVAGTIAVHYHGLINGAKILRVHDVKEASDSIEIYNALMS